MRSIAVRVEDELHRKVQRKLIDKGFSMQHYITGLIAQDMANDNLCREINMELLDDASVLKWLKSRLSGTQQ